MKIIYVPKGETVAYENLITERLVVDGFLKVAGDIKAKTISGQGVIEAGWISADSIRADDLESSSIACQRMIAKRVVALELFASESAAVSCLLSANYVKAGRLAVAISDIGEIKADEVINLKHKKRSLLRFLLASSLRAWWMRFTAPQNDAVDADFEPVEDQKTSVVDFAEETKNQPAA